MTLNLPGPASIGDDGHVAGHNLIVAALTELDGRSLASSWKGTWSGSTAYTTGDTVAYGGSTWLALVDVNAGGSAPAAGATWGLVAQKGDTGPAGADGAAGPAGAAGAAGAAGPAGADGADGSILASWRGDWPGSGSYSAGDVVAHNGSTWLALVNISAGTPASLGRTYEAGGTVIGATPSRTKFTVSQQITVSTVEAKWEGTSYSTGFTVGIASAWDGTGTIPYLGKHTKASNDGTGVWIEYALDAPVTLNPGTDYYYVCQSGNAKVHDAGSSTGSIATLGPFSHSNNFADTGVSGYHHAFGLIGVVGAGGGAEPGTDAAKWSLVAQKGDTGATGPAGADGAGGAADPMRDILMMMGA